MTEPPTQPPSGWSTPGEEPPPPPPGYGPPPPPSPPPPPPGYGYGPPPPGYGYQQPAWGQPQWGQPQWGAPVVTPGVVPLRPLTVGEVLDGAVKVIRRYPKPTLGLSAIIAVVSTVLGLLVVLAGDYSSFADNIRSGGNADDPFANGTDVASIPVSALGWLAGLVLTGFLVVVVGKAVLGQPATFGETWQQVRRRIWALLGLALLTGLITVAPIVVGVLAAVVLAFISPVLLIIGIPVVIAAVCLGIYLYVRVSLATAALVLEKATVRTALTRSGVLVKGDWWRVFGILLLVQVISSVVGQVLVIPFAIAGGISLFSNQDSGGAMVLFLLVQVGTGLATFLVSPFTAGARALLYVDRRMRAEGLDLTLQAAARG